MGDAVAFGAEFEFFAEMHEPHRWVCFPYLKPNLPASFELLTGARDCALS